MDGVVVQLTQQQLVDLVEHLAFLIMGISVASMLGALMLWDGVWFVIELVNDWVRHRRVLAKLDSAAPDGGAS